MSAPATPSKQVLFNGGDNPFLDALRKEDNNKIMNQSYDELLEVLDKNISSVSINIGNGDDEDTDGNSTYNISEDVAPLNLKANSEINTSNILDQSYEEDELMQDIPRVPSFDELQYNTHLNRTTSLSRVSGPRKFSNPSRSVSLIYSNGGGRDNSPSKKSVIFESSPPKVLEYDQLTPENSDDSFYDEIQSMDEPFNSTWSPKQRKDLAKLIPPSPPKHFMFSPSPKKDTSMNSSDVSLNLTREDLGTLSMTVEERLDLFLDNDELNQRHYEDELNRSIQSSPAKSITKEEQSFLLKIKSKREIQETTTADLFEEDITNNDKLNKNFLQLAPSLKRKDSNNSLRDEERILETVTINNDSNILTEKAEFDEIEEKNELPDSFIQEDITPESPVKSSYQSPIPNDINEEVLANSTEQEGTSVSDLSHVGDFLETSVDVGKSFVEELKEDSLFNSSPDTSNYEQETNDILLELNENSSTPNVSIEIPNSLDPTIYSANAFDTDLFSDKQSDLGVISKKKSIDFLSIWHENPLPIPTQVQPQYSVRAKQKPPKKIMKLIKSFHDYEHGIEEEEFFESSDLSINISDFSISTSTYTKEDLFKRSSLIMKSASKSSVINKQNLFQHPYKEEEEDDDDEEDSSVVRYNDKDILPDISNSSDFAEAFIDWEVKNEVSIESKIPKSIQRDLKKFKDIWNNTDPKSQFSSICRNDSLQHTAFNYNEDIAMIRSNIQQQDLEVMDKEEYGVDISFDGNSFIENSSSSSSSLSNHVKLTSIKETPLKQFSLDYSQLQKSRNNEQSYQATRTNHRLVSTNSFATGFNLDDDFDKMKDEIRFIPIDYEKPAIEKQIKVETPEESIIIGKKKKKNKTKIEEFTDQGRLYIHINSLEDLALDQVTEHKAQFSLSLDNCTHVTETPLLNLTSSNFNKVDKEFEIVLQKEITDLYFNLKVKFTKNKYELVEKLEKIPIKKGKKFSQIFSMKPKYKFERRYVTQEKSKDQWDTSFSEDGTFGKNKIEFNIKENTIKGKKDTYIIELFNDWRKDHKNGQIIPLSLIGKLNVTMLYIPRTFNFENLPPSIQIAESVAKHWLEQSLMTYEGYLHQEGGDCLMWKRRFFKLRGIELIGLNENLKPRVKINLSNVKFIFYKGKKFIKNSRILTDEFLINDSFKLIFFNNEILNFKADLRSNQLKWIEILEKVIELNKLNQPWVKLVSEKLY